MLKKYFELLDASDTVFLGTIIVLSALSLVFGLFVFWHKKARNDKWQICSCCNNKSNYLTLGEICQECANASGRIIEGIS